MWADLPTFVEILNSPAATAGVAGAVCTLFTLICVYGVPALINFRKQRQAEKDQDHGHEEKGYLFVIGEVTRQRDEALAQSGKLYEQLLAAVQEREFLKGQDREKTLRIEAMEEKVKEQHEEIKELRKRMHTVSDKVGEISLKQAEQDLKP